MLRTKLIDGWKELILATTMMAGFVIAEIPADIKDYTQTSAKYDLNEYGNSGLAAKSEAKQDHTS